MQTLPSLSLFSQVSGQGEPHALNSSLVPQVAGNRSTIISTPRLQHRTQVGSKVGQRFLQVEILRYIIYILLTSSKECFFLYYCLSDILLTFWASFVLITKLRIGPEVGPPSTTLGADRRTYRAAYGQPKLLISKLFFYKNYLSWKAVLFAKTRKHLSLLRLSQNR